MKKLAINGFVPISYAARKVPNKVLVPGKSSCLAQLLVQPATASLIPDPVPGVGPFANKAIIAHASLWLPLLVRGCSILLGWHVASLRL